MAIGVSVRALFRSSGDAFLPFRKWMQVFCYMRFASREPLPTIFAPWKMIAWRFD
jgi:hypothetical protein